VRPSCSFNAAPTRLDLDASSLNPHVTGYSLHCIREISYPYETMFTIDLHIHTMLGSSDSSLDPAMLAEAMHRRGVDGVLLTEHDRVVTSTEIAAVRRQTSGLVFAATEWSTDLGHILVLGLERRPPGLYRAAELRDYVLEHGGFMIAAHPFRYFLQPWHFRHEGLPAQRRELSIEEAAGLPLFRLVDAIESFNGNTTEEENGIACAVAERLGLPQTGGSDAHAPATLGTCITALPHAPECMDDLITLLREGRSWPTRGQRRDQG
jgi:predicted metal-dependent phosphoesterase TrpH